MNLSRRLRSSFVALLLPIALAGCAATLAPATGDLRLDLSHQDPRVRIDSTLRAVVEERRELTVLLLENLSDPDGAVRMFSAVALRRLTGASCGFKPHGTLLERQAAIRRWEQLLEEGSRRPPEGEPVVDDERVLERVLEQDLERDLERNPGAGEKR